MLRYWLKTLKCHARTSEQGSRSIRYKQDGKVDLDDFLEYMVGSLSRSTRMREHYKALSDFNCRMENLVQGLLVALDKDPVEEMRKSSSTAIEVPGYINQNLRRWNGGSIYIYETVLARR